MVTKCRWVKEGRQPGLSLILASQQPGAIDQEVLSQCDLILCHKVTASDDVDSLNRLSHDYMARELKIYLRQLSRTREKQLWWTIRRSQSALSISVHAVVNTEALKRSISYSCMGIDEQ